MQGKYTKALVTAAAILFVAGSSFAGGPNGTGTVSSADVLGSGNPGLGGTSTVYRGAAGIGMNATVTGLAADLPYTVWVVIFNNPQHCANFPAPCTPADSGVESTQFRVALAARNYADDNGDSFFSGFVPVGDALFNANRAEVHFVYRRHPDVDGREYESLNMFAGNCDAGVCLDDGFSIHQR